MSSEEEDEWIRKVEHRYSSLPPTLDVRAERWTVIRERTDYGVGEGGIALTSNPAFEVGGIPVTMDNIVRAETATYLCEETARTGPNRFRHERAGIQLDAQTVIRSNFDQIYSYAVFDASAG